MLQKQLINKIHHGDCLELFKLIPNDSVDMVFADPPFNLKKHYDGYGDDKKDHVYLEWCTRWLTELVRVTKPTGSIFVHNIPKWLTSFTHILNRLADFQNWIVWDAQANPFTNNLLHAHYGILFYAKSKAHITVNRLRIPHARERSTSLLVKNYGGKLSRIHPFGPLLSDVWTDIHRVKNRKHRDPHPCQLPLPLLERLILLVTEEKAVVLDPFIGTGTTAVAAVPLGRRYIGFEQSKRYVAIAKRNLKHATDTSKIGDAWVSMHGNKILTLRDKDWKHISRFFKLPASPQVTLKEEIALK